MAKVVMPILTKKLSKIYVYPVRIRGPYFCKDGRNRIDLVTGEKTKLVLVARAKLEAKLGRKLKRWETVDHIDEDKTNDRTYNLQVLSRADNAYKSIAKVIQPKVRCALCRTKFRLSKEQCKPGLRKKAGPFCSRSCSGKYGKSVQVTGKTRKRKDYEVKKTKGE